jgi:hypothetical protein
VIKPGERPADRTQQDARERAERRRRLAEIFGEVIPEQTSDDRGESGASADRRTEEKAQEDWLKSQVPPHHG